ncbi:MAG TPA: dienelactone hydrolase family protein [Candidatus Saccharimonadales bacterium]|jgi:carboxymethylenebutenolidase|nr:dienelactone hydrolase family protein [Candidatus Saccharimonadales bacterium]
MGEMITLKTSPETSAYLAKPGKGAARGAVIVIHEVWGLDEHIKSVADRVAAAGYLALAPALISHDDIDKASFGEIQQALFDPERRNTIQPQLRKLMAPMQAPEFGTQTIARVRACFDYLYDLPESQQKVAVMGFCFGGSYSFTLATVEPRLVAAIPFYGHADHPPEELAAIACPVRAFYGEKDERLMNSLPELKQRMQAAKVDFEAKVYPDCGHAFFNDSNRFAYNQEAATDAWQRVLELLRQTT